MDARKIEENVFKVFMIVSLGTVLMSLAIIIGVVVIKGLKFISLEMLTQTSTGGFYIGRSGGILNAIIGSLYLVAGGTAIAFPVSIGVAMFLQKDFASVRVATFFRTILDILWGVPSIVYGVFIYVIMIYIGWGPSLIGGIFALSLVELPIMVRGMDEVLRTVPQTLKESSYALGSTKIETAWKVLRKQAMPGIVSAVFLAFGRGIGDAASILYTSGFSDYIPTSLFDSTAALPTMVYFLATSPSEEVRGKAYAAAFVLIFMILFASLISRYLSKKFSRTVVT